MSELGREKAPGRLLSLDAFRGFTMLTMASAGLGIAKVAANQPFSEHFLWDRLVVQVDHTLWRGCSFWDMIQPSFMFIVGVAMPFSYASRRTQGQTWVRQFGHALLRSVILVLLGVFLSSQGHTHTNWSFVNVLSQIGLGYAFVFVLMSCPIGVQACAVVAILAGYWSLFAFYPVPPPGFRWSDVGIHATWEHLQDFALHWEKNSNVAAVFDRWFLNLFPGPEGKPFQYNDGGYTTLNFVPSMATMLLGALAGRLLRSDRPATDKLIILLLAGTLGVVVGSSLDPQVCPLVKRIWTPSWTIYSAGWAALELMAFYWLIDLRGLRRWAFPLVVVGMNSIAMYMMAQLTRPWVRSTLKIHLGRELFSGHYGPIFESMAVLFVWWLVCLWMYKRKVFLRI